MTDKRIPTVPAPEHPMIQQSMDDSFVVLRDGDTFDVKLQYWDKKKNHAVSTCYVRRSVYQRLVQAQQYLPEGYRLRVWDGWRPLALQEELYAEYSAFITERFELQNQSEQERDRIIRQFISYPSRDRMAAPAHTTGGAVDVTLIDACGRELPMGTDFDNFTEMAHTDYYETEGADEVIRRNRRILYHCMTKAGFTNLPSEWWHYDYGDLFWAYYNNTGVAYQGVFTNEEVYAE